MKIVQESVKKVASALASIPKLYAELKLRPSPSTVALSQELWIALGGSCPDKMCAFKAKSAYDGNKEVLFPELPYNMLLTFKEDSYSNGIALAEKSIEIIRKVGLVELDKIYRGFSYGSGKDITGFVDGTNNYDETLKQTGKLASIASDEGSIAQDVAAPHAQGSNVFVGIFEHDLKSFHTLSSRQKSRSIGRQYGIEKKTVGRDGRIENPRLAKDVSLQGHIFKGWGEMYRQCEIRCVLLFSRLNSASKHTRYVRLVPLVPTPNKILKSSLKRSPRRLQKIC